MKPGLAAGGNAVRTQSLENVPVSEMHEFGRVHRDSGLLVI